MKGEFATFDAASYLDNEEVIAEYLTAAAEDENPAVLLTALADVAKARGMAQVALAAHLGRESLYKALAPGAHPRFETIHAVFRALKVRIAVKPGRAKRPAAPRRRFGGRVMPDMDKMNLDQAKELAEAAGQSVAMDHKADYLQRGRRFKDLSLQELEDDWERSARACIATGDNCQEMHDLNAEMAERHVEPPMDRIMDELKAAAIRPGRRREVRAALREYLEARDKPEKN